MICPAPLLRMDAHAIVHKVNIPLNSKASFIFLPVNGSFLAYARYGSKRSRNSAREWGSNILNKSAAPSGFLPCCCSASDMEVE